MKKVIYLISVFCVFHLTVTGQSMSIDINGNASFNNLIFDIKEAGEDFQPNIESESNLEISITYINFWDKKDNPNEKWRINVHKSDITWNSEINLQIKRSGDGNSTSKKSRIKLNDGENFQTITNTPSYFFRGKDEVENIPLDIQLNGISLAMGAQEFETNIILTVYDD